MRSTLFSKSSHLVSPCHYTLDSEITTFREAFQHTPIALLQQGKERQSKELQEKDFVFKVVALIHFSPNYSI